MSGLYNVIFGVMPYAGEALATLGVTDTNRIGRLRDVFLNKDGSELIIYTRTGGNNRDEYTDSIVYLRTLPGYLGDEDDPYDNTYAIFRYRVPEEIQPYVSKLVEKGYVRDPWVMWAEAIAKLNEVAR